MKLYRVNDISRFAQCDTKNQVAATSPVFIGGKVYIGVVFENTDKSGKKYKSAYLATRAERPELSGISEPSYEDLASLLDNVEIGPRGSRKPLEVSVRKKFIKPAHYSKRAKNPDNKFVGKERFVYNEKGDRLPVLDTDIFVDQTILDDGRAFAIVLQEKSHGKTKGYFGYIAFYEVDPDYKWEESESEGNADSEGKATETNAQEGFTVNG